MDIANNGTTNTTTDGLMRAQTLLWSHVYNHVGSMSLKCAVELGIPGAIHNHEGTVTIPQLLSSLSIPPSKAPQMRRLMRMLAHLGIFATQSNNNFDDDDDEVVYSLTPVSSLLVENVDLSLNKYVLFALHPFVVLPFQSMSTWFKSTDDEATPVSLTHGFNVWEMTRRDPNFSKLFNEGMASDAELVMHVLVKDCGHVFDGITSLVDVGGGTGTAARAIVEAFPRVKCSVLELPQVVNDVKSSIGGKVDFICGDMFEFIPPADAVLLKWILHDWSDKDCVKILKRCKESIKENGGKVIIIDEVVDSTNHHERSRDAQLKFDVLMMVLFGGAERNEKEWRKIFIEAGFKHYEITPALGVRSVIELYP